MLNKTTAALVVVFSLIFAAEAVAQLPSPVITPDVVQVSDNVFVIYGFPNIVFVVGEDSTLVVDTALGPVQGAKVVAAAEDLAPGNRLYLTTTHFHPEHAAGDGAFPEETILIRPDRQQAELERDGPEIIELFKGFGTFGEHLEGVTEMRTPDVTFSDHLNLDLGGVEVSLYWLGVAHTEGDELIWVKQDKLLIAGDIVQNKVVPTVAAPGGSLTNWLNILTQLEQLQPVLIVPTHSRVGDGSILTESRDFIQDLRARTLALYVAGTTQAEAAEQILQVLESDYPQWAANTDWNNTGAIAGFVATIYQEAESFGSGQ